MKYQNWYYRKIDTLSRRGALVQLLTSNTAVDQRIAQVLVELFWGGQWPALPTLKWTRRRIHLSI